MATTGVGRDTPGAVSLLWGRQSRTPLVDDDRGALYFSIVAPLSPERRRLAEGGTRWILGIPFRKVSISSFIEDTDPPRYYVHFGQSLPSGPIPPDRLTPSSEQEGAVPDVAPLASAEALLCASLSGLGLTSGRRAGKVTLQRPWIAPRARFAANSMPLIADL
jgi:hypothetical protein